MLANVLDWLPWIVLGGAGMIALTYPWRGPSPNHTFAVELLGQLAKTDQQADQQEKTDGNSESRS